MRTLHVGRNTLPFQQFHVLFHSLFKVLFIFPSQYLFAIGLSPVFSLRWNLPPAWSCIPKQLDSSEGPQSIGKRSHGALTLNGALFQGTWTAAAAEAPTCNSQLAEAIPNLSFCRFTRRYWGNPCWFLFLRLLICLSSAGTPA